MFLQTFVQLDNHPNSLQLKPNFLLVFWEICNFSYLDSWHKKVPRLRKSSNPKKSLPNPFLEDFCQLLLGSSVLITWIHRLPKFVMWWHYTLTSNFFLNTNNKLNLSVRSLVVDWSLSCKADCTEERFWCRASQFSSGFDVRLNSTAAAVM